MFSKILLLILMRQIYTIQKIINRQPLRVDCLVTIQFLIIAFDSATADFPNGGRKAEVSGFANKLFSNMILL